MADRTLFVVAKLLRVALGYGSRTERIQRLVHNTDPDVAFLATRLKYAGYLRSDTVELKPEATPLRRSTDS